LTIPWHNKGVFTYRENAFIKYERLEPFMVSMDLAAEPAALEVELDPR
jgi:hypothetical protein